MKNDTSEESGLTVGVDLEDRWSRDGVPDPRGQSLEEDTIAITSPACRELCGHRSSARVVIEVGTPRRTSGRLPGLVERFVSDPSGL